MRFTLLSIGALLLLAPIERLRQPADTPASIHAPVPVEIVSNLTYMHGGINGSPPLDVVLDTGSSLSIVTPAIAAQIDLQSSGSGQTAGLGKGADQTLHFVDAATLSWGAPTTPLRLDSQRIAILPIDYIGEQTGHVTQGIFGSNLFLNFCITVDYAAQQVTFQDFAGAKAASLPGESLPIEIVGGVPFTTASIQTPDGSIVTGRFLLDSGTAGALIMNKSFLDAHPQLTAGLHYADTPSVNAVGGSIAMKVVRLSGLKLGSFRLSGPVAAVPQQLSGAIADPGLAGFIGAEVMRRFTVTWDYKTKQMVLVPNVHFHDPFLSDASGLHLTAGLPDLRKVTIAAVLPGSPADKAHLLPGDVLLAVDGKRDLPLWQIVQRLRQSGSPVNLSLQRDNKRFSTTLHLRSIV